MKVILGLSFIEGIMGLALLRCDYLGGYILKMGFCLLQFFHKSSPALKLDYIILLYITDE